MTSINKSFEIPFLFFFFSSLVQEEFDLCWSSSVYNPLMPP